MIHLLFVEGFRRL